MKEMEIKKLSENFLSLQEMHNDLLQEMESLQKNNTELKKKVEQQEAEKIALQREKEQKVQQLSGTYDSLIAKMKDEIAKGEVTISELKGKLTVNMVDSILFDSGKAEVKPEGLEVLDKVAGILKDVTDKVIQIEGHTDNVKIIGALAHQYPTNWELSAARAINVTRYLAEKGIDPSLLTAEAHGEYSPVSENETEEGRARNRRIEIILVAKEV